MIGSEVIVTVLEVRGDQVRLGITAPRRIDVHREEVFLALQEANAKAAAAAALVDDEELEESEDLDRAAADR